MRDGVPVDDADIKNTELLFHRKIAAHLEGLDRGDGLRMREVMWHYVKGDMKENAGAYYGRRDLNVQEKAAATKILAEMVLEEEGNETNAGIEWIGEVLEGIGENESVRWFCQKIDFEMHDELKDEGEVGTRIALLDKARLAHERLAVKAPDSAGFARDLSVSYNKLGDLQLQLGNLPEALHYYQQDLAIAKELQKRAPDSADFARDLVFSYYKLASFCHSQNRPTDERNYLSQCKQTIEHMKQRGMFVDAAVEGMYKRVCGMGI
jgi:tetratricopeptide (TPR) repeat protein